MPVASEFGDADERRFVINGKPVIAKLYKKVEGERETVSAVFVSVQDKDAARIITDAFDATGRFNCNTHNPIPNQSPGTGVFITDPSGLLSAGQILDEVDGVLTHLQSVQKMGSRLSQATPPARTMGLREELTRSKNLHVSRLLCAVYDAFEQTYGTNRPAFRTFMQGVNRIVESNGIIGKIASSSRSKWGLIAARQAKHILAETGIESQIMTAFHPLFPAGSLPPSQEKYFETNLEDKLKTTVRELLSSRPAVGEEPRQSSSRG